MDIDFGQWVMTDAQKRSAGGNSLRVKWDERLVINGHILIAGGSGTGKTHTIRKIIDSFVNSAKQDVLIHLFDVHDDIHVEGASDVFFSESTNVGLNPLIVDPDRHSGGVRKAIQNFITTINKSGRQLGARQEAVLYAVLEDLYAANGFYSDKPETWMLHDGIKRNRPKRFPTIEDLARWTNFKYRQMFIGGDSLAASALDNVNRESSKIHRLAKDNPTQENQETLEKLKEKAIDAYSDYVSKIKLGRELDELLKFDSKTTLKSVLDRVDNLKNSGIFKNDLPNFDPSNPIWRYRIKSLTTEEKRMFVLFRLKELYDKALRRGEQDEIVEVAIIDEASLYMDSDPENIIAKMANEIRKFGTAIICASQSFTHFPDDFLASVATKIILGIDEMYFDKTVRQLQVKKQWLEWISPKRTCLITMKRDIAPNDPTAKVKWFFTSLRH